MFLERLRLQLAHFNSSSPCLFLLPGYSLPAGRGAWTVSSEEFSRHFTYFLHLVPPGGLLSGNDGAF